MLPKTDVLGIGKQREKGRKRLEDRNRERGKKGKKR